MNSTLIPMRFAQAGSLRQGLFSVPDYRWSENLSQHSWGAVLIWMLLLIALQAINWPLVRRIFTRLPDRGWGFGRLITMILGGLLVWYPASLGALPFRTFTSIAMMLLLAGLCWIGVKRIPASSGERIWFRNPTIISGEIIFWIVFFYFLLLRSINPDSWHPYWGGEKPMEFAHLNALLRTESFPPHDPWYAGGTLNYYYFGTYLVANLIKITGIPAEIAFNLAVPTFAALLSSGAFAITVAIGKRLTSSNFGAILSGVSGVFLVQFAGNLIVPVRLWDRAVNGVGSPAPFVYWVWEPTRALPDPAMQINITEFPYFTALYADLHPHMLSMPMFTMIIALAWQLAATWRGVPLLFRHSPAAEHTLEIAGAFVLAGVTLGVIWMTNSWDMPTAFVLIAAGVLMMGVGIESLKQRLALLAFGASASLLIAGVIAWPFNHHFKRLFGSIGITTDQTPLLAVESHLGAQLIICSLGAVIMLAYVRDDIVEQPWLLRSIGVVVTLGLITQWFTSDQTGLLVTFAELAVVLGVAAIWSTIAWQSANPENDFGIPPPWLRYFALAAFVTVIWLALFDHIVLALYLGIGLNAVLIWLGLERQSARFLVMLTAAAILLGAMLELVYLIDDLNGSAWYRMNTIFKFYNQIWLMLGIVGGVVVGVAAWRLLVWDASRTRVSRGIRHSLTANGPVRLTIGISLPLLALMGAYALVATPIRLDQRFDAGGSITLNAYSWMDYGYLEIGPDTMLRFADDLEAITWINTHIEDSPVIAEASFGPYRCFGSRYSTTTGLPTVIGWVRHEMQQRDADDLVQREADLRRFYTGEDIDDKRAFLDRYQVEYVVLGQMEVHYPTLVGGGCEDTGNPVAVAMIQSMEGSDLEIVFQTSTTTIYRVIRHAD